MAKREFLQLAHKYNPKKHGIGGWFMSEKLDGLRAFWDGGISRNVLADDVPWANTAKDYRLKVRPTSTGLWTRYGKVIHAPRWFLDELPNMPLDGELWSGHGRFQETSSIVKRHDPDDRWKNIKYMVFDSPNLEIIFADGKINNQNFKKEFSEMSEWSSDIGIHQMSQYCAFETVYSRLQGMGIPNLHLQIRLPFQTEAAIRQMEMYYKAVLARGGEGLILRCHTSTWAPERSHYCLKYKPFNDAEGQVVGYYWGKETDVARSVSGESTDRNVGKLGALKILFNGKIFKIGSGFTDYERIMEPSNSNYPGKEVDNSFFSCPAFPLCSIITFKYRELTDEGIPKEASFWRKP